MQKYKYIIVPLTTLILCQIIKFLIESIKNKRLIWSRLFNGSGGMPSSHTSFSTSITILLGLTQGFESPLFGMSLVFTLIVVYDAMGLRMETGKQAKAINQILDEINKKENRIKLKEQLGHKPIEVLIGLILGVLSPIIFTYIIF